MLCRRGASVTAEVEQACMARRERRAAHRFRAGWGCLFILVTVSQMLARAGRGMYLAPEQDQTHF